MAGAVVQKYKEKILHAGDTNSLERCDSRTDTILERMRKKKMGGGGVTNDRPASDHVIWGPGQ